MMSIHEFKPVNRWIGEFVSNELKPENPVRYLSKYRNFNGNIKASIVPLLDY